MKCKRFTEHTCTAFGLLIKPFVWWCSLTSWFAPDSVHTTSEEFKNAYTALFLRLGLRCTVIHHENGAFRKRSSNRRNLKTPALSFRVDGEHFKTDLFGQDRIRRTSDFPGRDFLKQKHKTTGDCCVFKFLRWSVDDRAKFPRLLIKSIIRRCSSMSPKRKNRRTSCEGKMHHR